MAKINRKQAPYYDDYDSNKQYTQLLAIPGRVAQAREITQIQSTVKDIVKSIGDSILKDGNIIEGCQVSIDKENKRARISPGKVYIDGMVLPVRGPLNPDTGEYGAVEIGILGEGTETIGVKLMEYIITEQDDNTLRDPAQGYDNYNQAGCHRIKSEVVVVKDDPAAATLVTLFDGAVSVEKYAPDYDVLTQTLARRTYDESGSYIVEGMNVRVEKHPTDNSKFNVVVESGKAYVLGYELKIPAPRRVAVPRSLDTVSINANHFRYTGDYTLISTTPYIRAINSVYGGVSKTVTQTIQNNTAEVLFDESNVFKVVEVRQGETTYTVGTIDTGDCYLRIANDGRRYLSWRGTENYPILGSEYSVTYHYDYEFTSGIDYELTTDNITGSQNIHWISDRRPLSEAQLNVNYDLYLARKDLLYIDQFGNIDAVLGIPATAGFETLPDAPVNTLALAYIESPPAGVADNTSLLNISVSNVGLTRFTMNDIQKLLDRIRTMEYDQTILSLNNEAKSFETSNDKKGIFTDPMIDISKVDLYYNLSDGLVVDDSLPVYDATLDLDSNICYIPPITDTIDAIYNASSSSTKTVGRTALLKKSGEIVVLSQNNATKSFLINPYSMFPQDPEISIDPAVDVWIDDTIITVPVSRQASSVVNTATRYVTTGSGSASTTYRAIKVSEIGAKVDVFTNDSIIKEESITYIRQRTINVEGSNYPPDIDLIKGYFDGVSVELTPTGSTEAGSQPGSVKADSTGKFTAKFTIPTNIRTGIREVRLESDVLVSSHKTSAFALYQASGTARTIQRTVTTLTTVLLNRVTTITTTYYTPPVDPVGQTFVLDRMTLVSGIDLYFEAKAAGTTPVTCEIREVSNGNITSTVYGHKTLPATQVNISSDSTKATRFEFESPVLLEANKEYAFVVRSTSPSYRIWIAELGENDILTTNPVLSNPYLIGVMLSSSNNSSWTTHQTSDVKFQLIADTYEKTSEAVFDTIEVGEDKAFSRLYMSAESLIPTGTSVDWYYSLDEGSNMSAYKKITPYTMTLLNQMKRKVSLKAILTRGDNNNLSPIIALDTVGASLSSYDYSEDRWYITKEVAGLSPYTTVDIILDAYYPSAGTSLEVWISNGTTMKKAEKIPETAEDQMNYGWKRQTYKVTLGSTSTKCRIFVKMVSNSGVYTPAFRRLRSIMS